jgi:putative ABC transport system substrate-binding protein
MRRRELLAFAGCTSFARPAPVTAQQRPALPVIGYLATTSAEENPVTHAAFLDGLKDAGYVDGRNVAIEYRWAHGRAELFPAFASELVALKVAVIVAPSIRAALAARDATQAIPIVFVAGRSVEVGLADSLNRPGGNATGVDLFLPELTAKRLELLRDLQPDGRSVAYFVNPDGTNAAYQREMAEAAARTLRFDVQHVEARTGSEIEQAFARFATRRPDATLSGTDPLFYTERRRFIALAAQYRVPAIYEWREHAADGGLISLGPSLVEVIRMAGVYTARILAGARPADLPVQRPTRLELVVNLKTARALGLAIPPVILARADAVIE